MARIVAISSQVARGHVGLNAIVPALQRLGHEVVALPTILLSNHPAHPHFAGERIAPDLLARMLDALEANGWLGDIDGVLTGYLPSAAHVAFAADAVRRIRARSPLAVYLCDPVLGDDPKGLYVATEAAEAVRDTLLPLADITTPNRFELAWLSESEVADVRTAISAARKLPPSTIVATSIPQGEVALHTLAVSASTARSVRVDRRSGVPNGTGDMLAALYLGWTLAGSAEPRADTLATASAGIQAVIDASRGADELRLVASVDAWVRPSPLPVIDHES
jgi:pyridoxine kinase